MTPKTTTENLLYWAAALGVSVLLSFLSSVAMHWPEGGVIDGRAVTLDVIQTLLTTVPVIAAGFGLPRLGKENLAALVSEVGHGPAQVALEAEAVRQATGITGMAPEQVADIVAAVKAEMIRDPEGRLAAPRVPADFDPREARP